MLLERLLRRGAFVTSDGSLSVKPDHLRILVIVASFQDPIKYIWIQLITISLVHANIFKGEECFNRCGECKEYYVLKEVGRKQGEKNKNIKY